MYTPRLTLPTDSEERKNVPLLRGCLRYFPAALAGVARISDAGNRKHNPGQEMHHARGKSSDHGDCIVRHLVDVQDLLASHERGQDLSYGALLNEVNQLAWRALALSQELHERFGNAPLAPGARLPQDPTDVRYKGVNLIWDPDPRTPTTPAGYQLQVGGVSKLKNTTWPCPQCGAHYGMKHAVDCGWYTE